MPIFQWVQSFETIWNNLFPQYSRHLTGLLLLTCLFVSIMVMWVLYRRGCPTAVKITGFIINRVYLVWPSFPYSHSTWVIGFMSVFSFIVFLPFTNRLVVNVTAVYATILFLEGTLRKKVPLLSVQFGENPSWSKEEDTDLVNRDDDYVLKQQVTLRNSGDADADKVTMKCRVVSSESGITQDWERVEFGGDESFTLESGGEKKTELFLDSFDNHEKKNYLIEVRAKPNVRQGDLAIRKIHHTVPKEAGQD
ncbi:hypothetical protein SAMN05192554_110127 [Haloarchaeobius iranensis]|uniref:Uncharacterized protein n=1 Tax=Haloarchaeobius iranensis TaxID=996166 RepID=A0A1G9XHX4_9EURY|nr:hypothetical protein SAMN05192554_110127 [Haloarchaeobius iranensis]